MSEFVKLIGCENRLISSTSFVEEDTYSWLEPHLDSLRTTGAYPNHGSPTTSP